MVLTALAAAAAAAAAEVQDLEDGLRGGFRELAAGLRRQLDESTDDMLARLDRLGSLPGTLDVSSLPAPGGVVRLPPPVAWPSPPPQRGA